MITIICGEEKTTFASFNDKYSSQYPVLLTYLSDGEMDFLFVTREYADTFLKNDEKYQELKNYVGYSTIQNIQVWDHRIGDPNKVCEHHQSVEAELQNLTLNMAGGLLPENLSAKEIALLESSYGPTWFEDLGYSEPKYKKPVK